jgi:hypothetical protein
MRPTQGGDGGQERRHQEQANDVFNSLPDDISADELRDFLDADDVEVEADPLFRERLRRKLWTIVRDRFSGGDGGSG